MAGLGRRARVVAGLTLAAAAWGAQPAMAQAPAPAATQTTPTADPAKVVVARQIVAIALPPEHRMAMVDSVMTSMLRPMRENLVLPPNFTDKGLKDLFRDFMDSMPGVLRPVMERQLPALTEAMAHAYARSFTQDELDQILAFAKTPAGTRYFSRAATLLQDPEIAAVNGALFRDAQQAGRTASVEFQAKVKAYLAAHPQVAQQLSKGAK